MSSCRLPWHRWHCVHRRENFSSSVLSWAISFWNNSDSFGLQCTHSAAPLERERESALTNHCTETQFTHLLHELLLLLLLPVILTFNVTRMYSIKDPILITARRLCWTVFSCQTPPVILLMSTFTQAFHVFLPLPLLFAPSTSNYLHADTQSLLTITWNYIFRWKIRVKDMNRQVID